MGILLVNSSGETKVVEENENYNGREWKAIASVASATEVELQELAVKHGMLLGDMVEAAIKLMPESIRPAHCTQCERRKQGLNWLHQQVKEIGEKVVERLRNA